MIETRTCGECGNSECYEDATNDPFCELPEPHRSWLCENCCVCVLKGELPLVLLKDTDPDDIPCDFWDE